MPMSYAGESVATCSVVKSVAFHSLCCCAFCELMRLSACSQESFFFLVLFFVAFLECGAHNLKKCANINANKLCLRSARRLQNIHVYLCCSMCRCNGSQLSECGVTLKMFLKKPQTDRLTDSRSSQVLPDRSVSKEFYTAMKS